MKIQTLTLTTLAALLIGGAAGYIADNFHFNYYVMRWWPAFCIGTMLAVGKILDIKGVLIFPEKEPYQDKG
jgi:hypothetical protein